MTASRDIAWDSLRFDYIKTPFRFIAHYRDGEWQKGELSEDEHIKVHEGSTSLHYGQQCFEGLKAYRTREDNIVLFRPDQNAARMKNSAEALLMQPYPEAAFIDAVKQVVRANADFVPPYGTGASLYIRPYLIGVGANVGVKPAPEYIFSIFTTPVGPYFAGGLSPCHFITSEYDRAAPMGTGGAKVGGNYAASMYAHKIAVDKGFADCIYLDPATHTKIEEVGAANFFGIIDDTALETPKSPSILPSITKYSLLHLAEKELGMKTRECDIPVDDIEKYTEAGACGTAAVITPIGSITHREKRTAFYGNGEKVGPVVKKLYDTLTAIQFGDREGPEGWSMPLE